ncbi:hypothetical protein ACIU0H_28730 [Pseudomonas aeruginosa]
MTTPLLPQEIYLLERYSSPEYYSQMRDTWAVMLKHVEDCLDRFMRQLPADYRARSQPLQPDIVWGQRVIPIFRDTMQDLNTGVIKLTHGDLGGLLKGTVSNDFRGQVEFSSDWMDEVEPGAADKYWKLIGQASTLAFNIDMTVGAYWNKGALAVRYSPDARGPLNPPPAWPRYRLNPDVQVRTGEPVLHTGIYLPDLDDSNAQFLLASRHYRYAHTCPPASVGYDPQTQDVSEAPALWTLVERVPGETVPLEEGMGGLPVALHVYAGQPCPRAGFWFTLARHGSRRHFEQGEIFPAIPSETTVGLTLWQWDPDQASTT